MTTRLAPPLAAVLVLASTATGALAQERAGDDGAAAVVVTATRTPKAVDRIPGAVSIIGAADIDQSLLLTEDATAVLARLLPGYAESTQALSNTGETLRGRIALRLFDGVPQTSPLRETNRSGSFTDLDIIGRIEVINGPSAAEGIGASGGIIHYLSRSPARMGDTVLVDTAVRSQFAPDAAGYKAGAQYLHRDARWDVVLAASQVDRGIASDGHGRRIGMNASGSLMDTRGHNVFLKLVDRITGSQQVALTASRFRLGGKGGYVYQPGDRASGRTDTAVPGRPFAGQAEFNDFRQYALSYTDTDLAGGTLAATAYRASQAMRFVAENGGADKQDPLIAPLGTLTDQSEVNSQKHGLRTGWTKAGLVAVPGLELHTGVDVVQDRTEQKLALTNRTWVPPMVYRSRAPYAQLNYDDGPVTLAGGVRREDGTLDVDSYTTTYYNKRQFVQGGTLEYQSTLPNAGAVWRFGPGWSAFASYAKGFSLPNVGIPLRNVNKPGQSVQGILDLQAVIADNKEVGLNWRGQAGSVGLTYYRSYSDLGVALRVDPVTNDFVMRRLPVLIKGVEMSGEWRAAPAWRVSGLYSHMRGWTVASEGGPLTVEQGVANVNPDKIGATASWDYASAGTLRLGFTTLLGRTVNPDVAALREQTGGYTLFDLSVTHRSAYGQFSLGIENLANKFYLLTASQVPGFQNYTAGRGRVVTLSHRIAF